MDDLNMLMAKGRRRRKLFHALQLPIRLHSLRERPEDIPLLLDHFLRQFKEVSAGLSCISPPRLWSI